METDELSGRTEPTEMEIGVDTAEEAKKSPKIYGILVKQVIPMLHKSLSRKKTSEGRHKLGGRAAATRSFDEDEDILRVPIALALLKLLLRLPPHLLQTQLPSIFMKVCQLLKSRSKEIRELTRKYLCGMMDSLGPQYLRYAIREMRTVLTRGYQMHVFIYTSHVILSGLASRLQSGDLDPCLSDINTMCHQELFGAVAEEKEVEEITRHLMEAKANKTRATFYLLGKFLSQGSLDLVLAPLQEVLETKQTHEVTRKVGEVLKNFSLGLAENEGITGQTLMIFAHQILAENIPKLFVRKKKVDEEDEEQLVEKKSYRPKSTYLLEKEPGRAGAAPRISKKSSLHVLVEFALQVLLSASRKLQPDSLEPSAAVAHLDPFVPLLVDCVKSKYEKVICLALRCLGWCMEFPLPTLRTQFEDLVAHLFLILHQHAGLGAATSPDTIQLNIMLFKTLTTIIREVEYYRLKEKQLEVLLNYAETDLADSQKQGTAFSLVKAILGRGLTAVGVRRVVEQIRELAIVSLAPHVRLQARQVILHYLTQYAPKKNPREMVEFFLSQLEYEFEDGRISAFEMLNVLLSKLPQRFVEEYSGLIFVQLAMRLVNEESEKCRKMATVVLGAFLANLSDKYRDFLFELVTNWLGGEKKAHCRLGTQLVNIFLEQEGERFERRVEGILEALNKKLDPEGFREDLDADPKDLEAMVIPGGHVLSAYLLSVRLVLAKFPDAVRESKFRDEMLKIWEAVRKYSRFPREEVHLGAAQLCGQLLAAYSVDDFRTAPVSESSDFLLESTVSKVRGLCADSFWQLRAGELTSESADQAIKNLVFLSKIFRLLPSMDESRSNLEWMADNFRRVCNMEIVKDQKKTIRRASAFKWLAAVSLAMELEDLSPVFKVLLPHLHREITLTDNNNEELSGLAGEVADLLKKKIGLEQFSLEMAKCQKAANEKRVSRKRERALNAVVEPEKAARRKMKKQKQKAESRKRKLVQLKPYRAKKRRDDF